MCFFIRGEVKGFCNKKLVHTQEVDHQHTPLMNNGLTVAQPPRKKLKLKKPLQIYSPEEKENTRERKKEKRSSNNFNVKRRE